MTRTIRIAAAVVLDTAGQVLLVRKRGTAAFMLPGGKIEPGEAPDAALRRELHEEIGCACAWWRPLGQFAAVAANEPGHRVEAALFHVGLDGVPAPAAEIDALLWLDPENPGETILAPLAAQCVLPLAAQYVLPLAWALAAPLPIAADTR